MAIPTWSPGEVLASADVNNWFVPQAAIRTTDSALNLTTTFTSDNTLLFPMTANAIYEFRFFLIYSGSVTSGFKAQFAVPSGTTGRWAEIAYNNGGAAPATANTIGVVFTSAVATLNGLYMAGFVGSVTCGSTAGNFQVQYAENASDTVNGAFIRANSFLSAQRLA